MPTENPADRVRRFACWCRDRKVVAVVSLTAAQASELLDRMALAGDVAGCGGARLNRICYEGSSLIALYTKGGGAPAVREKRENFFDDVEDATPDYIAGNEFFDCRLEPPDAGDETDWVEIRVDAEDVVWEATLAHDRDDASPFATGPLLDTTLAELVEALPADHPLRLRLDDPTRCRQCGGEVAAGELRPPTDRDRTVERRSACVACGAVRREVFVLAQSRNVLENDEEAAEETEPERTCRDPSVLSHDVLAVFARSVQQMMFLDADGRWNPDKEVNGGDLVDVVTDLLKLSALAPYDVDPDRPAQ